MIEPIVGKNHANELDRKLYLLRCKTLKQIIRKCEHLPNTEFKMVVEELENILIMLGKIDHEVSSLYCYFFINLFINFKFHIILIALYFENDFKISVYLTLNILKATRKYTRCYNLDAVR